MLFYERKGNGKTVVFIHGFLESSTMWNSFNLENAPFESILIDLPGHGQSPLLEDINSISEVAVLVINTLTSIGITNFDIVGHSLGGYVAIEIHKKLKLKSKLVLFHSNFWEDDTEKKANRNRVIKAVRENKTFFIQEAIPNLFLEPYRETKVVRELIEEARMITAETIILYSEIMRDRPNQTAYVLDKNNQVYIVQGDLDAVVPIKLMKKNLIDVLNLYVVNGCGHMGHIEAGTEVNKMLKKILDNP